MINWFTLGKKIGRLTFFYKNYGSIDILVAPDDLEYLYSEIIDFMCEMKLDTRKIVDAQFKEYEDIIIKQICEPNKNEKHQLFLLGIYREELELLVCNELDCRSGMSSDKLLSYIINIIDSLKLDESLKNISIKTHNHQDFEDIDRAIKNKDFSIITTNNQEVDNTTNKKIKPEYVVAIIGVVGSIIAAIITALL